MTDPNRWLLRYYGDRRQPSATFCVPMTADRKREVARAGLQLGAGESILIAQSEHLARIPGIVYDALAHSQDDGNFRRPRNDEAAQG